MNTLNALSAKSAAEFLEKRLDQASCDSKNVADCVRCNAIYLARYTRAQHCDPQAARDAERYRFLRDREDSPAWGAAYDLLGTSYSESAIDNAIDTAIAATQAAD